MSSRSLLDEPADLNAEPGSKSWARAVAREIRFSVKKLDGNVEHIQEFISIASEHEAWKVLGYLSLDAFLIAEANFTQAIIDAIRQAKPGTKIGDVVPLREARKKQTEDEKESGNNITTTTRGTDTTYTLRRLARDCPEMLDKIEAGELSVNQAAIKAGIRKKPTPEDVCIKTFRKVENRIDTVRKIIEELQPHEVAIVGELVDAKRTFV